MRTIRLTRGKGNGVDSACLVTASNMLCGRPEDLDNNSCVCDIIQAFAIVTNDLMPLDLLPKIYGPLAWEIIGTRTEDESVFTARSNYIEKRFVEGPLAFWFIQNASEIHGMIRSFYSPRRPRELEHLLYLVHRRESPHPGGGWDNQTFFNLLRECQVDLCDFIRSGDRSPFGLCILDALNPSVNKRTLDRVAAMAQSLGLAGKIASGFYYECADVIRSIAEIGDTRPKENVELCMTEKQLSAALS